MVNYENYGSDFDQLITITIDWKLINVIKLKMSKPILTTLWNVKVLKPMQFCTCFIFCIFLLSVTAKKNFHMHFNRSTFLTCRHLNFESFGNHIKCVMIFTVQLYKNDSKHSPQFYSFSMLFFRFIIYEGHVPLLVPTKPLPHRAAF